MPFDDTRSAPCGLSSAPPSPGVPAPADGSDNARPALPEMCLPSKAMEIFDPARHLPQGCGQGLPARAPGTVRPEAPDAGGEAEGTRCEKQERGSHENGKPDIRAATDGATGAPHTPLPLFLAARANPRLALVPRVEDCHALWRRYGMMDHITAHSAKVADFALALALAARKRGSAVLPEAVLAAGLLHDLGKTYTILHGGNHAQLGAAWTMRETGNAAIARAVMFHVHWPFAERFDDDDLFPVLAIIYADKRTMHDSYVSLDRRFDDLVARYATSALIKERILLSHAQGKRIEAALSRRLGVNVDECTADSGRLVK